MEVFIEQDWVDEKGNTVKIKDLTNYQLKNIVRYLRNRFVGMKDPFDYRYVEGHFEPDTEWKNYKELYDNLENKFKLFETYYKLRTL